MSSFLSQFLPQGSSYYSISTMYVVGTIIGIKASEHMRGQTIAASLLGMVAGLGAGKLVERLIQVRNPSNLEKMLAKVLSCKATNDLYRQAQIRVAEIYHANLTIKMKPNVPFGGCGNLCGEILISTNQSEKEALHALIFELANMTQVKKFEEIDDLALAHRINRKEYASRMEEVELETINIYLQVIKAAKKENGVEWVTWPDTWIHLTPKKVHLYFARLTGHTGMYHRQWDEFYSAN